MKLGFMAIKNTTKNFFHNEKWILVVMLLLFLERLIVMAQLGATYTLSNDDLSYVNSGITFIETGAITMHGVLSAQIMPGMPVFIGIISLLFGEGTLFWIALKLIWITMGVWSAFFIYKSVSLFAPSWCGIVAALLLSSPDFVWMDNVILTETPFMLCLSAMVYFTFMMAKTGKNKYFWLCLTSYFLALMLKANIGIYPVFALIYLLLKKYDIKVLFKQPSHPPSLSHGSRCLMRCKARLYIYIILGLCSGLAENKRLKEALRTLPSSYRSVRVKSFIS